MIDNRALVAELVASNRLRVAIDPSTLPAPEHGSVPWNRVAGMLAGLCIGDSLGNTSESRAPGERRAALGEVREYQPNSHAGGRRVGLPSDDTQLAIWSLEHLIEHGGLDPSRLGDAFADGKRIFGIGSTVRGFLSARAGARHWLEAAQESAGNGAIMRIAPVLLPHLRAPSAALWADALLAGAVTHNDYASNAACVAWVGALWSALHASPPVAPGFWLEPFVSTMKALEGNERRYHLRSPHLSSEPVDAWELTSRVVREALERDLPAQVACDRWYSGAYLLETLPSLLYVLERHGNDPEEAIVRAVNDTRDNDTIASLVGAAMGALHGTVALPKRWRDGLLGRTTDRDDGHLWAVLDQARTAFGGGAAPSRRRPRRTRPAYRGCLLGGAVGDALGAPVEFIRSVSAIREQFGPEGITDFHPAYGRIGAITDDTQMTLFTAEALIRAEHRMIGKGICSVPNVAHCAYLRWLRTQGIPSCRENQSPPMDGWLVSNKELHARRAPGNACTSALASGVMGEPRRPINDSKGCGGVMRMAPVGLAGRSVFNIGCELAAITHGHPTGWMAAGYFAQLIDGLVRGLDAWEAAIAAKEPLIGVRGNDETLAAVDAALALARQGSPTADRLADLGEGWVAEEALAIGLYCALAAKDFAHGVLLAVNHGGDSDSTGSIAGNILGLVHGEEGIPSPWLDALECRELIAEVAEDLWLHFGAEPSGDEDLSTDCRLGDSAKYPGG